MQAQSAAKWAETKKRRKEAQELSEDTEVLEVFLKFGRKGPSYCDSKKVNEAKRDIKKLVALEQYLKLFATKNMLTWQKATWEILTKQVARKHHKELKLRKNQQPMWAATNAQKWYNAISHLKKCVSTRVLNP